MPLSIQVTGIALNHKKLASDLTGYLTGKQAPPRIDEYKIPGYLIALAMLPLAIPIVTLGGWIPGAIGGTLAFLCLILMKKSDIAAPLRVLLVIAITVIGFVATFGILAAFVVNRGT